MRSQVAHQALDGRARLSETLHTFGEDLDKSFGRRAGSNEPPLVAKRLSVQLRKWAREAPRGYAPF